MSTSFHTSYAANGIPRSDPLSSADDGSGDVSGYDDDDFIPADSPIRRALSLCCPPSALHSLTVKLAAVASMFILVIVASAFTSSLYIMPRTLSSLIAVALFAVASPSVMFALAVVVPLTACAMAIALRPYGTSTLASVFVVSGVCGGLIVWLSARPVPHYGIGGTFAAFASFLLTDSIITYNVATAVVAVVCAAAAVLPFTAFYAAITYEPLLAGAVVGAVLSTNRSAARTAAVRLYDGALYVYTACRELLISRQYGDGTGLGEHSGISGTAAVGGKSYQQVNENERL